MAIYTLQEWAKQLPLVHQELVQTLQAMEELKLENQMLRERLNNDGKSEN